MSAWAIVLITIGGVLLSAATNLVIVGIAIGRYKKTIDDCTEEIGTLRTSLAGAREDIARIKGRINGKGWTRET